MLAWITPIDDPGLPHAGIVWFPAGAEWQSLPIGAYAELLFPENYEQIAGLTPDDAADAFQEPGYHTARKWGAIWNIQAQKILSYHDQNLTAYWPLFEALGGTRARDFGAGGFHGTTVNGTFEATGIGDGQTAIDLSGSGSRINVYSTAFRDAFTPDDFSIALWVSPDDWSRAGSGYFLRLANSTSHYVMIYHTGGGYLNFAFKTPSVAETLLSYDLSTPGLSGYHGVGLTGKAGGKLCAYLDDQKLGEVDHPGSWGGSQIALAVLGAFNTSSLNPLDGKLAHVAIWGKQKNDAEMAHLLTL